MPERSFFFGGGMRRVLITNDDGIDAAGIRALASLAGNFFEEVWVVAPSEEASQIGHRVTTHRPLKFVEREPRVFAVDGSPADCTRVGLHFMGDPPDWVWSGINHGGNLGLHDYHISGTLAAAREAAFHGVRAMGASHFINRRIDSVDWEMAAERVARAFQAFAGEDNPGGVFWSVNLPHLTEDAPQPKVVFCEPERRPLQVKFEASQEGLIYRGDYRSRPHGEGSDVAVCFGGDIAVSRIRI